VHSGYSLCSAAQSVAYIAGTIYSGQWFALMMEAASTSETSENFYQTTRRNNPQDSHLYTRRLENLKSLSRSVFHNWKKQRKGQRLSREKYSNIFVGEIFLTDAINDIYACVCMCEWVSLYSAVLSHNEGVWKQTKNSNRSRWKCDCRWFLCVFWAQCYP
jgi:hypothetical protein